MEQVLKQKYFVGIFILIFLGNLFNYNPQVALWDEDEAAYAGFAMQMAETGDWVNPDFFWSEKHRKPPFHFWTIAVCYKLFGINEFTTRLPSAVFAILTLLAMVILGGKAFGAEKAKLAAMILAASLLFPSLAKVGVTDATLLFFETVAALSLILFIKKTGWKYGALFWGAIAFGVLVKGPPILIMALGIWGFLLLFKQTRGEMIRLHPWIFLPLSLVPLLAWGYFSWQKDGGETVRFMLDWYIFKRVGGSGVVLGQTGPPGYHLAIMLLAFLPLFSLLPAAFWDLKNKLRTRDVEALFYAGWLLFGWLFYEIMPSKLPAYALGAYPAVAFLIAGQAQDMLKENYPYRKWVKVSSIFFMLLMFIMVVLLILGSYQLFGKPGFSRGILAGTVLWGVGLTAAFSFFSERFKTGLVSGLVFGLLFTFLAWWAIMPLLDNERSVNRQAGFMAGKEIKEFSSMFIGNDLPEDPSLAFYLSCYWGKTYLHEKDPKNIQECFKEGTCAALLGESWFNALTQTMEQDSIEDFYSRQIIGRASEDLVPITYYLVWRD